MKTTTQVILRCLSCIFIASALNTHAATVTQKEQMNPGDSWDTGAKWSDGNPASAGNDYVNDKNNWLTRTPTDTATFAGDSLTISNGARLQLQTSGGQTTINNLIMVAGAGSRIQKGSGGTSTLAGNISLIGTGAAIFDAQTTKRLTTVTALLTAASTVDTIIVGVMQTTLDSAVNTTGFIFTNAANTFTGTWDVQAGLLKGSGLGTASFQVGALGFLDFDTDYMNTAGSLSIVEGGKLLLDQNLTFGAVTIQGTQLSSGIYTGADLKESFSSVFAEGSLDGKTITVIPEPSASALWVGLGGALLCIRSRSRQR